MELLNTPWEAIAARLKGEATDKQLLEIKEWLDDSPENPEILSEILNIWSLTKHSIRFYNPDGEINWAKLMKRIGHAKERKVQLHKYYRWLAAASVLILVFIAGIVWRDGIFKQKHHASLIKITAPAGSKTRVVLPDSTHIWLNSGSELEYPGDFDTQNRHVIMKGECFFDVSKDPQHPFLIDGTRFRVKVFGTRVNINEAAYNNEADVALISGNAEVYDLNNALLSKLNPGLQFIQKGELNHTRKIENAEAVTSWINDILVINNLPFVEVKYYIEKWYGVKIDLEKSLYYNYNYTFKVKTESLREVLDLISFITPIDYKIEGNQVTIKARQNMKK